MAQSLYARLKQERDRDPEYRSYGLELSFIEQVLEVMEKNNVSKAELARRLDTSRAYVTRLLDGTANVTLLTIAKVCIALQVDMELVTTDKIKNQQIEPVRAPVLMQDEYSRCPHIRDNYYASKGVVPSLSLDVPDTDKKVMKKYKFTGELYDECNFAA